MGARRGLERSLGTGKWKDRPDTTSIGLGEAQASPHLLSFCRFPKLKIVERLIGGK